jgi:hypothetical protein
MGAGAPWLGDLKGTNFDKPEAEGGAMFQFSIDTNFNSADGEGGGKIIWGNESKSISPMKDAFDRIFR